MPSGRRRWSDAQLDRLSAQRIDALVVAGGPSTDHVRHLAETGLPVADAEAFAAQAAYLANSTGDAIDAACEHLAALGHRGVTFLTQGRHLGARCRHPGGTSSSVRPDFGA